MIKVEKNNNYNGGRISNLPYDKLFGKIAEDNGFEYDDVYVFRMRKQVVVVRGTHRCIIKYEGAMTKEKFKNLIESHLDDLDVLLTMGNV